MQFLFGIHYVPTVFSTQPWGVHTPHQPGPWQEADGHSGRPGGCKEGTDSAEVGGGWGDPQGPWCPFHFQLWVCPGPQPGGGGDFSLFEQHRGNIKPHCGPGGKREREALRACLRRRGGARHSGGLAQPSSQRGQRDKSPPPPPPPICCRSPWVGGSCEPPGFPASSHLYPCSAGDETDA